MASAAAIIDMARNGFLYQHTTNKEISENKISMFHDFPEELHINDIMCAVQGASATRQSKTNAMYRNHNAKKERDNMMNQEGLEKATYEFIQCLIYRQMWDSDRRWKIPGEVKEEVRALKLKKDKE